ncbi:RNA 2'-phosphotransferase [Marinicella sp. W31]|uniref:RNA 2'-phosphotransferase n=1 Tax=Marinicella sp. W31 TaxID=3023713 RepID=UPI003756A396
MSELSKISKFLSFILRHRPDDIGLKLDNKGWVFISELIKKAKPEVLLTKSLIQKIVVESDKQRFKISEDGLKIRANQGHSVKIDLGLKPTIPPAILYHGTATRFLDSIMQKGLTAGQRHHVHLSSDIETARAVGQRYGKPAILQINAEQMHNDGYQFFLSDNHVWLTNLVVNQYILRTLDS